MAALVRGMVCLARANDDGLGVQGGGGGGGGRIAGVLVLGDGVGSWLGELAVEVVVGWLVGGLGRVWGRWMRW